MRLTRDAQSQVFEYACHEGNEGMRNMLKAARESQVHTTWINPDEAYEEALSRFVRQSLAPGSTFLEDIASLRDVVDVLRLRHPADVQHGTRRGGQHADGLHGP